MNSRSPVYAAFGLCAALVFVIPARAQDTSALPPMTPGGVPGMPASVPSTLFSFSAEEVPIKQALRWLGVIASAEVRGPLCPPAEATAASLRALMQRLGLI